MAPVRNARVLFKEIPTGYPEPGKTTVYEDSQTIDTEHVALNGGFLLKTLVLSVDPYLRGRMRPVEIKSYAPAFHLNEPLDSLGVGVVVRSEYPSVKPGDHIYGNLPHQEYNIIKSLDPNGPGQYRKLEETPNLPWQVYVGAAGMPGQTAYAGWRHFSHAKKNETAFVSGAAGPVGSMVIQLAKQDGMKVIACAGTEDKVKFLKNIGADVAYNYKETDTDKILATHGPIDVYWDNVGGAILDSALLHSNVKARFIECGMISGYNEGYTPIKNINKVLENQISMNGFIIFNLDTEYREKFYDVIPQKLASGELKYTEEVTKGLDKVGDVILANQKGKNRAKSVVMVAEN